MTIRSPSRSWILCTLPVLTFFRQHYRTLIEVLCAGRMDACAWLPATEAAPIDVDLRDSWPLNDIREPFWVVYGKQRHALALDRLDVPFWRQVTAEHPLDYRRLNRFVQQVADSFGWCIFPHRVREYADYHFVVVQQADIAEKMQDLFLSTDHHVGGEKRNVVLSAHELSRPFSEVCTTVMFTDRNEGDPWISGFVSDKLENVAVLAPTIAWYHSYVTWDVPRPWPDWFLRECRISSHTPVAVSGLESDQIELAQYFPLTARAFNLIRNTLPSGSSLFVVATDARMVDDESYIGMYCDLVATQGILPPAYSQRRPWVYWRYAENWGGTYEVFTSRENLLIKPLLEWSTRSNAMVRLYAIF